MSVTNSLGYTVKAGAFSSGKFEAKINDVDINGMSDDVQDLKTEVSSIQTNIGDLSHVNLIEMSDDIKDLKTNVSTAQSNITSLQSSVSTDQTNITALQTNVSSLQSSMTTAQSNIATLQTNVSALQLATLTISLTSGTTYTFPTSVVQDQQIFLINAQSATNVTVATTYTDATSSMVLAPGDKLAARGGIISSGAIWLIGI